MEILVGGVVKDALFAIVIGGEGSERISGSHAATECTDTDTEPHRREELVAIRTNCALATTTMTKVTTSAFPLAFTTAPIAVQITTSIA